MQTIIAIIQGGRSPEEIKREKRPAHRHSELGATLQHSRNTHLAYRQFVICFIKSIVYRSVDASLQELYDRASVSDAARLGADN